VATFRANFSRAARPTRPSRAGVDIVDQRAAATINPHGCKFTIWHRMHDHYLNIATLQADTHHRLVIETHGSAEQKLRVNGSNRNWNKLDAYGKAEGRTGGQRADDLRWELLEEIAKVAQFGSVGDPQVQNLQRGRPVVITPAKPTAADPGPSGAASDGQYRVARWQGDEHAIGRPVNKGKCALVDCQFVKGGENARLGCTCCGKRFCGFTCYNRHVNEHGVKYISQRKAVEFQPGSDGEGD
jgi:hypothetical protein